MSACSPCPEAKANRVETLFRYVEQPLSDTEICAMYQAPPVLRTYQICHMPAGQPIHAVACWIARYSVLTRIFHPDRPAPALLRITLCHLDATA